jgi:ribosome-associated protein
MATYQPQLYSARLSMSQNIQFDLTTEYVELCNLLKYVELCNLLKLVGLADSGGRGKTMVAEGLVKVDGLIETRKTAKIRTGQKVVVGNQTITIK